MLEIKNPGKHYPKSIKLWINFYGPNIWSCLHNMVMMHLIIHFIAGHGVDKDEKLAMEYFKYVLNTNFEMRLLFLWTSIHHQLWGNNRKLLNCRMASDQGHAHASHNLAVGHLKKMHRLSPGYVCK